MRLYTCIYVFSLSLFCFQCTVLYELAVDILYTISLDQQCRQKMLLTAIKNQLIEVWDYVYVCKQYVCICV